MKTLLYVHPSNHATERVVGCSPDVVVLDLEEAVPSAEKARARTEVRAAHDRLVDYVRTVVVRINSPQSETGKADLAELAGFPLSAGILLPKPLDPALLFQVAAQCGDRPLWLMAEQIDLFRWLPEVLANCRPIEGLVVGGKDLSIEFGHERYSPIDPQLRSWVADARQISQRAKVPLFDAVSLEETDIRVLTSLAATGASDGLSFVRPRDITLAREMLRHGDAKKRHD
jgi:citrate lyase subunit beta/citryl-CoA lyase